MNQNLSDDQLSVGKKSQASSRANRALMQTAPNTGVGQISTEQMADIESKFEDMHRTIEDIKDEQRRLQQELDKTANNLTLNKMSAMQAGPSSKTQKEDKQAAVNAEENKKKIKELESLINNVSSKLSREIESLKLMQPVANNNAGSSDNAEQKQMFFNARRQIEAEHAKFSKKMSQINIDVQHALTDIRGLNEHFRRK